MQFLTEWVTNIIIFILIATVIDMLLPSSSLQKYTKMVTGLLLIAIILTPVLKLISKDFETTLQSIPVFSGTNEKNMENLIEMKKREIQASNSAYILETMAVQLKEGTKEELMNQYGLEVANIEIKLDETNNESFPDNLQKVIVHMKQRVEEANVVEVIQPVDINTNQPYHQTKRLPAETKKIASLLAEKWNVTEDTIEVLIEGEVTSSNGS
jgi:stage III sporulation protein AF